MPSLTPAEARSRAAALTVRSYDIELDLTTGDDTFVSTARVAFAATAASTFVDIKPHSLTAVTLNGSPVDVAGLEDGRLALDGLADDNELVVTATMSYSHDGEGLHRSVDAADGKAYTYAMSFLDAAPRIFACFDQPDLKAPYRVAVTAPRDWIVLGNGAATRTAPGRWELARWELAQTKPLSTYFSTLVAGPYHLLSSEHDGIRYGLACRQSLAEHLDREAADLFEVTGQSFDEFHRLFGYRYPFGEYHQVFVPEFNAGAMENPGFVTFRDELVFRSAVTDHERASTHPVASDPDKDALASLADFDGISYAKGAAVLKQLASYLGDDVFLAGVRAHITGNEYGNATLADLASKWTAAGATDLDRWAEGWLRTPGLDTISAERTATGVRLTRTAPAEFPARRPHRFTVGAYDEPGLGSTVEVLLDGGTVDVELDPAAALIVPDAGDD